MSVLITPEIRSALDVNAPGSLIPTTQLKALVDYVEAHEAQLSADVKRFAEHGGGH